MKNIVDYLKSKGISSRPGTTGWHQADCLFCEGRDDLSLKVDSGVFYCHKCKASGNLWKLKKHFGDVNITRPVEDKIPYKVLRDRKDTEYHEAMKTDKDMLKYLSIERGLKKASLVNFCLGSNKGNLVIPYYYKNQLVNLRYRSLRSGEYHREAGYASTLFNVDNVDKSKDLLVVEGELDAISAWQLGYKNVVSVSCGAGAIQDDWIEFFDSCSGNIYIVYDNDNPGEKGARELARRVGLSRSYRVLLPVKDFNEALMAGYTKSELDKVIADAKLYELPRLTSLAAYKEKLDSFFMLGMEERKGLQVDGWETFNKRFGGLRESEITVVTGETSHGKTTFTLHLCYKLLREHDQPVLIVSSEMPVTQVVTKMFSMYIGKSFYKLNKEEYDRAYAEFAKRPLYFVDVQGSISEEELEEYIEYGNRRFNIKHVLLDHLHFFVPPSQDVVQRLGEFVRRMVAIKRKFNIHLFLIAHPNKLKNDSGIVGMNDLKGASAVKQDADNVLIVWRNKNREEAGDYEVVINFEKVRSDAGEGGKIKYTFDPETQTYKEKLSAAVVCEQVEFKEDGA